MWLSTSEHPPTAPTHPYPLYRHELATGTLLVAESADGQVIGFTASLTREGRWLLADLFVDPGTQSTGVGRRLLEALVDIDQPGRVRMTLASSDPRAVSLYARFGLTPRWPLFYLTATTGAARLLPVNDRLTVAEVAVDEFPARARRLGHTVDRRDLAYLAATLDVTAVTVGPPDDPLAAAVVRWGHPFVLSDPWAVTIAPLVLAPGAPAVVVAGALLGWIEAQGRRPAGAGIRLFVPGPHPLLVPLLEAGFIIVDVDTLCASDEALTGPAPFDPTRTCPATDIP